MDPVQKRGSIANQVQPEARPLALGANRWIGQPDRRHQLPPGQLGEHPGVDLVGLGGQGRQTPRLGRVGDLDVPAQALQGVVDKAGTVHRLDRRLYRLAVPSDPLGERPEGVGIGPNGEELDRPTCLVEDVHIELLAR